MGHVVQGNNVRFSNASLGPFSVVVEAGAELKMETTVVPNLDQSGGIVRLNAVEFLGDLTQTGGMLFADDLNIDGELDCSGGEELIIDGARLDSFQSKVTIDDTGDTYHEISVTDVTIGHKDAQGQDNQIVLTDLLGAVVEVTAWRAREIAAIVTACVGCDLTFRIKGSGTATDNTHPAVQLAGACDDIDLRGSVRGGAPYEPDGDEPSFAVEVDALATAIDVFMSMTGLGTGTVDDNTTGEVTVH